MNCRGAFSAPEATRPHRGNTQIHPAVLIAAWGVCAIAIQRPGLAELAIVALLTLPCAMFFAGRDILRLLHRARWLFIAIAVLFVASTPGERLPGLAGAAGISREGIELASLHLLRLALLLAMLAWMLRFLGRKGLLTGMYSLLGPLGARRDRLVVRLTLALEHVESERPALGNWRDWLREPPTRETELVRLDMMPLRPMDRVILLMLFVAILLSLLS